MGHRAGDVPETMEPTGSHGRPPQGRGARRGHDHSGHDHGGGVRGLFRPHSHDAADVVDAALESSAQGVRAVELSFVALALTAGLQVLVVAVSGQRFGRVAGGHDPQLLRRADRCPALGRVRARSSSGQSSLHLRIRSRRGPRGALHRGDDPQPMEHVGWVAPAGLIGFVGNELVAGYRIRVGRRIGSAALVADGSHAQTDGFTSLAVVVGAAGVVVGLPPDRPDRRAADHCRHPGRAAHRGPGRVPPDHGRRRPGTRRPGTRRPGRRRAADHPGHPGGSCRPAALDRPPPACRSRAGRRQPDHRRRCPPAGPRRRAELDPGTTEARGPRRSRRTPPIESTWPFHEGGADLNADVVPGRPGTAGRGPGQRADQGLSCMG